MIRPKRTVVPCGPAHREASASRAESTGLRVGVLVRDKARQSLGQPLLSQPCLSHNNVVATFAQCHEGRRGIPVFPYSARGVR